MMSDMDKVFRRILNDKDIFYPQKEIFNKEEWRSLKEKFRNGNMDEFEKVIQEKIKDYDQKINQANNNKEKEKLQKAQTYCKSLINVMNDKPNLLNNLFEYLDSFGLVKSNLPSPSAMDDYGKVIERYEIGTVTQFFLDKIERESDKYKKKALKKLLEYVKELYQSNQSPLEIAYFVRKLNSLKTLWEVLNE
jgi:predicted metal-binding protein